MIAKVKYCDYVGTTAGDISDFETLDDFLTTNNIDINTFEPIGIKLRTYYDKEFTVTALLKDKNISDKENSEVIKKELKVSKEEFFRLFKRLEIILLNK